MNEPRSATPPEQDRRRIEILDRRLVSLGHSINTTIAAALESVADMEKLRDKYQEDRARLAARLEGTS